MHPSDYLGKTVIITGNNSEGIVHGFTIGTKCVVETYRDLYIEGSWVIFLLKGVEGNYTQWVCEADFKLEDYQYFCIKHN